MTIPEKGNPEYDLWVAAIDIAIAAPLRRKVVGTSVLISWRDILALRAALEALGIDWQKAKEAS